MASWIAALKLVPWGEVIKATPQVVKAAQGMLKKKEAQAEAREQDASAQSAAQRISPPASAGEQALLLRTSIGLAQATDRTQDHLMLIQRADSACGLAREAKGERIFLHQDTVGANRDQEASSRVRLLDQVRAAR